jgi:hypothetical protein
VNKINAVCESVQQMFAFKKIKNKISRVQTLTKCAAHAYDVSLQQME